MKCDTETGIKWQQGQVTMAGCGARASTYKSSGVKDLVLNGTRAIDGELLGVLLAHLKKRY